MITKKKDDENPSSTQKLNYTNLLICMTKKLHLPKQQQTQKLTPKKADKNNNPQHFQKQR